MNDCLLYLISPPTITSLPDFANELRAACDASDGLIGAFQLRLKQSGTEGDRLTELNEHHDVIQRACDVLLPICQEHEISFIMNDDPQLAKACGADGVHLGQEDGSLADARALLGEDAVIGVSCHASRHLAMEAGEQGADYVAFGAFYPTTSKSAKALEHWGTPEPDILEWWTSLVEMPCVAIGGITPHNCAPLVSAGTDFIAAISSVWQHPQGAAAAINDFKQAIKEASS